MCDKIEMESLPAPLSTARTVHTFPLNLFPQYARPYLELIRIEKAWFKKILFLMNFLFDTIVFKPTGTVLIFWPFAWGLTMAAKSNHLPPNVYFAELLKCLCGAFIIRSSACTVNDIIDRRVDAGVERTQNRPLPSSRISVMRATIFLFFQYTLGVTFFYHTTHHLALWTAMFQLFPLFVIYPLLKRCTHWPQAWLGFAMNFGYITAWTATKNSVDISVVLPAVGGCWCWTMLYDTIYACQDIKDDLKMGVRSTAILFGTWIRPLLVACGLSFLGLLTVSGVFNKNGCSYFFISVGGTAVHLVTQYLTVDLEEPKSCWANFNRNGQLGWIIWSGMLVDYIRSISVIQKQSMITTVFVAVTSILT